MLLPDARARALLEVDVCHALCSCVGTFDLFITLAAQARIASRHDRISLLLTLFGHKPTPGHRPCHIAFVGQALLACFGRHDSEDVCDEVLPAAACRMDALDSWRREPAGTSDLAVELGSDSD